MCAERHITFERGDGGLRECAMFQCGHVTLLIQREVARAGAGCRLWGCNGIARWNGGRGGWHVGGRGVCMGCCVIT